MLVSVIKGVLDEKAFQDADGHVSDIRVVLQRGGGLSQEHSHQEVVAAILIT